MCVRRAFDSLAKVLQPEDGNSYTIEGSVSEEQSATMLELEGPLLSDMHVPFKVRDHHRSHSLITSDTKLELDLNVRVCCTECWPSQLNVS